MGSFFAGIKAGTIGGVIYVGGLAAFNVMLLYSLKPEVLNLVNQFNPSACPMVANVNGSVQDCFASLVAVDVPFRAFVAFFVTLLYCGLFGLYFDSFPTRSPTAKGVTLGAIVAVNLILFGFGGYVFDSASAEATGVFLSAWTAVFGYVLARLYRKYTRAVAFSSQNEGLLRVMVDGRDLTGKARTFATTSSHKLRAELADDASFREWAPSGGVTLEDSRSFETIMEVSGDGSVEAKVSSKY